MPAIQSLKKQLRGVNSTLKLTKAMKTVSTVKFSKLNGIFTEYSEYSNQCKSLLQSYGNELLRPLREFDSVAPYGIFVFCGNAGLCGSFNSEILHFAVDQIEKHKKVKIFAIGKKAITFFKARNIPLSGQYVFEDIPTYSNALSLLEEIIKLRRSGQISKVLLIFPKYKNMMLQTPFCYEIFGDYGESSHRDDYIIPDKETVILKTAKPVFGSMLFEVILETSLGAQAATLMTMRQAFDTATERYVALEAQINRMRQTAVTADVIETATEQN